MDNYPAGAAHDPRAPYNEVELSDIYGDRANELIDQEIDDNEGMFLDWAQDNDHLPEDYTDADVQAIASDRAIRDEYREYRFDDLCEELAEDAADYDAYCESEAYEAAREAYLLGEY